VCAIKLIVGLGNPGSKYDETRHNAGFVLLDEIARAYSSELSPEKKFQGDAGRAMISTCDVRLLKPTTYMNLSGESVQALASFYRIEPEQILVAHDELDIPPGTVKLKQGGGHGGHNGDAKQVSNFVLKRAPKSETDLLQQSIDDVVREIPDIVSGEMERAMKTLHTKK